MAINKNPTPSIPNIPAGLDATTALFLGAVKETIEVREGRRGTGEHRFLPSKEIIDLINIVSTEIRYDKVVAASKDPIHPPKNFSVRAGHWCNYLTWENPRGDALYAATEVWCNTTNSRSEASLIAVVTYPHAAYTHYIEDYTADHYYWIRGRSFSPGVYSTWVPTDAMGGVLVEGSETVGETISALMSLLEGQITEGQLYPLLNERLDKIPVLESAIADIQQVPMFDAERDWSLESLVRYEGKLYRAIQGMTAPSPDPTNTSYWALVGEYASLGEAAAVHAVILNDHETRIDVTEAGISANASDIVTLQTTVSDNTALIQTNASSIDGIMAKYTVKIDNNGVVAGYGLISEPNDGEIVSEFGVLADSFFVAKPGYANRIPFIIGTVDGIDTVAINGNLVVDGTILGRSIAADQITAGHIGTNEIIAYSANIANGVITNAKIANATITGAKIANATITDAHINTLSADKLLAGNIGAQVITLNGTGSNRIELNAANQAIRVYQDGVLRVELGKLS